MNLTIGQRLPLSQINIDETLSTTLKFTHQSLIEINISRFALDAAGKLINDDYMVLYNYLASSNRWVSQAPHQPTIRNSNSTILHNRGKAFIIKP